MATEPILSSEIRLNNWIQIYLPSGLAAFPLSEGKLKRRSLYYLENEFSARVNYLTTDCTADSDKKKF